MYTIKITVEGGCVVEVDGLPDGFDYEIIDKDELPFAIGKAEAFVYF